MTAEDDADRDESRRIMMIISRRTCAIARGGFRIERWIVVGSSSDAIAIP